MKKELEDEIRVKLTEWSLRDQENKARYNSRISWLGISILDHMAENFDKVHEAEYLDFVEQEYPEMIEPIDDAIENLYHMRDLKWDGKNISLGKWGEYVFRWYDKRHAPPNPGMEVQER